MISQKKLLLSSVVLIFFLCIQPGMAVIPENTSEQPATGIVYTTAPVHHYSLSPESMVKGVPSDLKSLNTIDKKNLTGSQKKLSTALLMQTLATTPVSVQTQNAFKSSLTIKEIPNSSFAGSRAVLDKGIPGELVYVYVTVQPGYSTHIIDSYVYEVTDRDEDNQLAVAWVDTRSLENLASVEGVRAVQEVIPPLVNTGSVTTQGEIIHKTLDVRSTYGYTGAGMKIGIISDGVTNIASSKASGDLPADVTVLSNTRGGDEGTAMLEIVHDMVPDAKLYFHDMGDNTIAFNEAIAELKASGCSVICDDISWIGEPFFEDGIIAKNITTLLSSNNVIYVSSAGNAALSHYQGDFYSRSDFPNWADFSRGADPTFQSLYVYLPAGSSVRIVLEWNDEFGHSGNDYDMLFQTNLGDSLWSSRVQNGTGDPLEYISYQNTGISTITGQIDIWKYSGVGKTLELFIYPSGDAWVYSDNIVASDSIFGHPAVPDVIAVAAVPANPPSIIEPFSSLGPVTISYPSPVIRSKPDISGVDCVAVTGAGGFGSTFCGTSASAPHIAAIAAQIWGAHPSLTPAQVRSALYTSAVDLGSAGKDTTFGYGRADALAMADMTVVPVTNFTATPLAGTAPLSVQFNDTSTKNPAIWNWSFGDGISNTTKNPIHTYFTAGNYTVSLNATNAWGSNTTIKTKYINVSSPPVANFTGTPITGVAPLTVVFTDFSTNGPGTWNWTFGDGNVTNATDRNPVHTYIAPGTYDVSLNVTYAGGVSNVTKKSGYIVVTRFPTTKIGVYQNGIWYLDYNGNGTWDGAALDKNYNFGGPGNTSITGDWNRDGREKVGVYNNGTWLLDYNGTGILDPSKGYHYWGAVGWTPLVGDWNWDGKTKVGVYKDGIWYLDYNGTGILDPSKGFHYWGAVGWTPLVGDWNGDGKTKVGVYKDGIWYLDYNGTGILDPSKGFHNWGAVGWTPLVGDWNGDGKTKVGVYKDGIWYLDYNGDSILDPKGYHYLGAAGWIPVIGKWN